MKGYGYFYPSPLVKEDSTGFSEDGISKGSFSMIRLGEEYDIIFKDTSGTTSSIKPRCLAQSHTLFSAVHRLPIVAGPIPSGAFGDVCSGRKSSTNSAAIRLSTISIGTSSPANSVNCSSALQISDTHVLDFVFAKSLWHRS